MAGAMKLGDRHTAIMDAIHGDLLRQNPGAFVEEDGNATLVIPTKPFLTIDVSSLAEAVLPLAASPPAPARDDVLERIREMDFKAVYEEHHYQKLADDLASPPAREEAPAERDAFLSWLETEIDGASLDIGAAHQEGGKATDAEKEREATLCLVREQYQALRNRTSEPEAGEVEMTSASEVLSLMTRDPVIVAMKKNGLSDSQLIALGYALVADRKSHPAPATADKLRVAVEALETAQWALDERGPASAADEVRKALAALNEQPQ